MNEKLREILRQNLTKEMLLTYSKIFLGCFLSALGLVFFISPYGLVPGGVSGLSIVLHAIFPSIQVGTFSLLAQFPLLFLAVTVLGGKFGARTLLASILFPLMINVITMLVYPDAASMQALDPTKILGGRFDLSDDLIVCTLAGGVLLGLGSSMVILQQASTGGSDIVAMILSRFTSIRFSHALMLIDGSIILFGLAVIGFGLGVEDHSGHSGKQSLLLSVYSLITMIVLTRTVAAGLSGTQNSKLVHIICKLKDEALLRDWIIRDLKRTATRSYSRGIYTDEENSILLLLVHDKELPALTEAIRERAPESFVVVTDAHEAYGLRWKALPDPTTANYR